MGAGPSRGPARGSRDVHRGDLRPVLPLDGSGSGGGHYQGHARARRGVRAHLGSEDRASIRRRSSVSGGALSGDGRVGQALPRTGTTRRARVLPQGTPGGEAAVLTRAGFSGPRRHVVPGGQALERTSDDVVAGVFSMSFSAPHLFGARRAAFESDVRLLLREVSPSGRFSERLPGTEVFVWERTPPSRESGSHRHEPTAPAHAHVLGQFLGASCAKGIDVVLLAEGDPPLVLPSTRVNRQRRRPAVRRQSRVTGRR